MKKAPRTFNVKKSFAIDNQVIIMEGDRLKFLKRDINDNSDEVDIYFLVVDSFWCYELEINLTPNQVAEYLIYGASE
jgi:hypothetical protein